MNGNNQWVRKGSIQYWNNGSTTANVPTGVESVTSVGGPEHKHRYDGQVTGGAGQYGIKFHPIKIKGLAKLEVEQFSLGWSVFGHAVAQIASRDFGKELQVLATGRLRYKKANGKYCLLVDPHDFYAMVTQNSSNVVISIPFSLPIGEFMPPFGKLNFKPPVVGHVEQFYPRNYKANGKESKKGELRIFYQPHNLIIGNNSPLEILRPIQGQVYTYTNLPSWHSYGKAQADLKWHLNDYYKQNPQSDSHPDDVFSSFVFADPQG